MVFMGTKRFWECRKREGERKEGDLNAECKAGRE
jgi:hypothetical protein